MKCFYHNDPDGWCSAFWVRKYCERENIPFTHADFIEVNYDSTRLIEKVEQGEKVFMVDFSVDPEQMILFATNTDFTWIDHHVSAIEKMQPYMEVYSSSFKGIRDTSVAACALTWLWYTYGDIRESMDTGLPKYEHMIHDAPLFTQYVHLWDSWQWKNHSDSLDIGSFILGLQTTSYSPLSNMWDALASNNEIYHDEYADIKTEGAELLNNLILKGDAIRSFRDGLAESLCSSIGKIIEFEGYRCFACNIPKPNSEWFKSVNTSIYDIMMPFYYNLNTELYILSLYTTNSDIDVSKIAEKYGGGGHKAAAGFQLKELPF